MKKVTYFRHPKKGESNYSSKTVYTETVDISTVIKENGDFKKWITSPNDNKRYYYYK